MTDAEYLETQNALVVIANMASTLDLAAFQHRIEVAEAIGPLIDPTGYRRAMAQGAGEKLETVKRLAKAARDMQIALAEARRTEARHG